MSTIEISGNIKTNNDTLVVNFTTDIPNIENVLLSKDGGETYISATSFTNTSASFDVSDWNNGTYTNCVLRCVYSAAAIRSCRININTDELSTESPKEEVKIALHKISDMTVYKGETFNILYSSNISAVKHEFSWDGGNTFWDKTSEILVENAVNYKYAHNADTEYDLFNMAIRVTDKNGNTDTGYFTITFENDVTENTPTESSDLLDSTGAYIVDDFSGTSIDENKWSYELGYVRNGESQRYTNSNAEVNNGILALRGLKDSDGNWTSSSIISKHHFAFMYGKIVARIKPCNYNGAFGAFWTLGDSFEFDYNEWGGPSDLSEWWPWCGEFDIMEFYNHNLTCGTFFGNRQESGRIWYNNYDTGAWHEFGMEWLENGTLIFTIDGNELSRTSPTDDKAFHIPHFILLNQAIGASGGTPDSNCNEITQYVDWVKYYPASTENLVLNSSDFELIPGDFQDNHCILRLKFNDNCINKSVNWSSSDGSIISVHNGLCAAVGTGNATITATSQSGVSRSIMLHSNGSTVSLLNNI